MFDPAALRYLETLAGTKQRATAQSLPIFLRFCRQRGLELSELTADHLEEFTQRLLWQPGSRGRLYHRHTLNQILLRTRQFLRWLSENDGLAHDPSTRLKVCAVPKKGGRILTTEELRTVLAGPERDRPKGLRDALLLELVAATSLAVQGCVRLNLGDSDRLALEDSLRQLVWLYLEEARPHLLLRDPHERALLLSGFGNRLTLVRASQIVRGCGRQVGDEGEMGARVLRRSYLAHAEIFAQRRFPFPLTDENP